MTTDQPTSPAPSGGDVPRFDFNAHHKAQVGKKAKERHYGPVPRIECADGFSLSAQASEFTYCTPRENAAWPYFEVEVGFPSERVEELMPFAESPEDPTGTVYGWVPVSIVEAIINAHGGPK